MKRKLMAAFVLAGIAAVAQAQEDLSQWSHYRTVTVNTTAGGGGANVAGSVTNFPLLVRLTSASAANGADVLAGALPGGADLRFTSADGSVRLAYEIERWSASAAEIWVRVPSVAGNSNTSLRMYWGKTGVADSSNSAAVFDTASGFKGVWHLGESAGPSKDATMLATDAAWVNSPVTANGVIGRAIQLNNSSNISTETAHYLSAPYNPANQNFLATQTGGITISAWVNRSSDNGSAEQGIAGRYEWSANQRQAILFTRPDGIARLFRSTNGQGGNSEPQIGTAPLPIGTWVHMVATLRNGEQILYIDGVVNATGSSATMTSLSQEWPSTVFAIGRMNPANTNEVHQSFHGLVDEVRFATTTRSADWVKLEYETQRPGGTAVVLGATQANLSRPLLYAVRNAVYVQSAPIFVNTPTVSGTLSGANPFSVLPALPQGLNLNTATGAISGTPTALSAQQSYVVTVALTEGTGRDTLNLSVTAGDPPGAPTGVQATSGSASATVGWLAPLNPGSSAITGYTVRAVQDTSKTCTWTTGPLSCTVTGLANGTAYTFTVTATNSVGSGPASAPSTPVTPASRPGAPTNVTAIQLSGAGASGTATVSWTAPATDGGLGITGTFAFGSPNGSCFAAGSATTCNMTGLTYGTAYTFRAAATNSLGIGDTSAASAPLTPTGILGGSFTFRVSGAAHPYTFVLTDAAAASTEAFTLSIQDIWGRTVWSRTAHPAQDNVREITWSGHSTSGRTVAAGMYVVRVTTLQGGSLTDYIQKSIRLR